MGKYPRVGFLFLAAQLICIAWCSALSNRKFSGEGKLVFEGVKVEIDLVFTSTSLTRSEERVLL